MFNQNQYNTFTDVQVQDESAVRSFMSGVFIWMYIALLITAGISYYVSITPEIMQLMVTETGLSIFGWVVMLAPIGFVLLMSFRFQKLSTMSHTLLFVVYSVLVIVCTIKSGCITGYLGYAFLDILK